MNARRTRSRIWRRCSTFAAGAALVGYFAVPFANAQNAGGNAEHWVGTWATAVVARAQGPQAGPPAGFGPPPAQNPAALPQQPGAQGQSPAPAAPAPAQAAGGRGQGGGGRGFAPPLNINNQTLRQIVHTSIAGERVRVVFSNAFGTAPLPIQSAHIALREKDASIVAKSGRALTFAGSASAAIPAGRQVQRRQAAGPAAAQSLPPLRGRLSRRGENRVALCFLVGAMPRQPNYWR